MTNQQHFVRRMYILNPPWKFLWGRTCQHPYIMSIHLLTWEYVRSMSSMLSPCQPIQYETKNICTFSFQIESIKKYDVACFPPPPIENFFFCTKQWSGNQISLLFQFLSCYEKFITKSKEHKSFSRIQLPHVLKWPCYICWRFHVFKNMFPMAIRNSKQTKISLIVYKAYDIANKAQQQCYFDFPYFISEHPRPIVSESRLIASFLFFSLSDQSGLATRSEEFPSTMFTFIHVLESRRPHILAVKESKNDMHVVNKTVLDHHFSYDLFHFLMPRLPLLSFPISLHRILPPIGWLPVPILLGEVMMEGFTPQRCCPDRQSFYEKL